MGNLFSYEIEKAKVQLSIEDELKENYVILKNKNRPRRKKEIIIETLKPISRKQKHKKKINHWKSQYKNFGGV